MRVALISDVHGNLVALDAVLGSIRRDEVDAIVCLGDVATLGPEPEAAVRRLQEIGARCVMGNHDAYVLSHGATLADANMPAWMQAQVRWASGQLSPASRDFLGAFKMSLRFPLPGTPTLLCVHGSPRSNEEMILSTTPAAELDAMLSGLQVDVLAHGHSHLQMARRHGRTLLLNPGSVGEPLAEMPFQDPQVLPWAEYALVNADAGNLGLELRRVPYDTSALIAQFRRCPMPNAAFWVDLWSRSSP